MASSSRQCPSRAAETRARAPQTEADTDTGTVVPESGTDTDAETGVDASTGTDSGTTSGATTEMRLDEMALEYRARHQLLLDRIALYRG